MPVGKLSTRHVPQTESGALLEGSAVLGRRTPSSPILLRRSLLAEGAFQKAFESGVAILAQRQSLLQEGDGLCKDLQLPHDLLQGARQVARALGRRARRGRLRFRWWRHGLWRRGSSGHLGRRGRLASGDVRSCERLCRFRAQGELVEVGLPYESLLVGATRGEEVARGAEGARVGSAFVAVQRVEEATLDQVPDLRHTTRHGKKKRLNRLGRGHANAEGAACDTRCRPGLSRTLSFESVDAVRR